MIWLENNKNTEKLFSFAQKLFMIYQEMFYKVPDDEWILQKVIELQ